MHVVHVSWFVPHIENEDRFYAGESISTTLLSFKSPQT